jgi:predicted dehydrogenase
MINFAVVGYGYWGPNVARNIGESEGARVAACCDLDAKRLARATLRHPGVKVTGDYGAILASRDIGAVAIATPVHTHFDLARRALEAGKHVLVEKPMTMRVDEAEELVALTKRQGLVLMVDHVFIYNPAVVKMKEIVDSGKLGKLMFIDSVRINLGLFQHDVNVVWDLAVHDLSIVDFLVGKLPRSLSAFGTTHTNNDVEDVAYLNLDFGNGLIANFHVNWLSPVKVRHMIIGGSDQSLIYNDVDVSERVKVYNRGISLPNDQKHREHLQVSYRSGDVWSPNISSEEALSRMVAHFLTCIREQKTPLTDGQAGLRVIRILDAAQRSIKAQGGRVTL